MPFEYPSPLVPPPHSSKRPQQRRRRKNRLHESALLSPLVSIVLAFLADSFMLAHCHQYGPIATPHHIFSKYNSMPAFLSKASRSSALSSSRSQLHSKFLSMEHNNLSRRSTNTVQSANNPRMYQHTQQNSFVKRPHARSSFSIQMISSNNNEEKKSNSISPWENPKSMVGSLLQKTTSRALRTLSTTADGNGTPDISVSSTTTKANTNNSYEENRTNRSEVQSVLNATIVRSTSILDTEVESQNNNMDNNDGRIKKNVAYDYSADTTTSSNPSPTKPKKQHQDKRTYQSNPGVSATALAHSLWRSTIIPNQDTVIDCTCGNGKDCLALARMLFPNSLGDDIDIDSERVDIADENEPMPQLIGIDIQSRAIQNTQRSLLSSLPSNIFYKHVSLLERSHEHLMDVPRDARSIGLICYNLGYLPGNSKECKTQSQTTLNSITDASLLLRAGGLLSIMTYPGSNLKESIVVEHFMEGLAMLTSRDEGGWRGYLESIPNYYFDKVDVGDTEDITVDDGSHDDDNIRMSVTQAIERVVKEGSKTQTWRVFMHKPLGRPVSPVLATAVRIK